MNRTWVFPMCGNGTRTKTLHEFKPFIKILDKFIFEWCIISNLININKNDTIIFITTEYFNNKYEAQKIILKILRKYLTNKDIKFIILDHTPQGPAKTLYSSKKYIYDKENIIVVNHDQFINFSVPENSNFLTIYYNTSPSKSYCEIKDEILIHIAEKQKISNHASSGVYGFKSGKELINALEELFLHPELKVNDEFYVSMCINFLINTGVKFLPITTTCKYDLGTIDNIKYFKTIFTEIATHGICIPDNQTIMLV